MLSNTMYLIITNIYIAEGLPPGINKKKLQIFIYETKKIITISRSIIFFKGHGQLSFFFFELHGQLSLEK